MEAFWNMAPVMIMQCNDVTTAATKEKQEDWEHIVLTMEGSWVRGLEGWHQVGYHVGHHVGHQVGHQANTTLPMGPKLLRGLLLQSDDGCI